MSPDRFGKSTPAWLRRIMLAGYLLAYGLITAVGTIGVTWPSNGLGAWQWALARISGTGAAVAALVCIASYVVHRWRWEMLATLVAGVALAGYVLVISTVAPLASRGLLLAFSTLAALGVLIRYLHLVTRALRWSDSRRAGREFDRQHGR